MNLPVGMLSDSQLLPSVHSTRSNTTLEVNKTQGICVKPKLTKQEMKEITIFLFLGLKDCSEESRVLVAADEELQKQNLGLNNNYC